MGLNDARAGKSRGAGVAGVTRQDAPGFQSAQKKRPADGAGLCELPDGTPESWWKFERAAKKEARFSSGL